MRSISILQLHLSFAIRPHNIIQQERHSYNSRISEKNKRNDKLTKATITQHSTSDIMQHTLLLCIMSAGRSQRAKDDMTCSKFYN